MIYDIEKAFDAMWLEDSLNDIYDSLPEKKINDEISLLYESNKVNMVAVKTAVGLTERINIPLIVQQGGICIHSILKRDKRGMLFSFFITQWYSASPGDWTEQVKLDLDDLNIQCDFYYIEKKSTDSFKRLVKRKAKDLAIENLQKKKSIHS